MAEFYRLVKTKFKDSAFTGEGAKAYGGRWNRKGTPCVYLGGSIAICVLETLVHLESPDDLANFTLFTLSVPDELISKLDPLPVDWKNVPAPGHVQDAGDRWLKSLSSLALIVPSTITEEANAILNPLHPDAARIIKTAIERQQPIDPRLFKS
jgi:RES domain-containing protein